MTNLLYSAKHYQIKGSKEADRAKNEADRAKSYAESLNYDNLLNKNMITNCITEIPQDIKLELNNGTLTLKAGSKVYVPNGFEADGVTPKFDEVVIENDTSLTVTPDNILMPFYSRSLKGLGYVAATFQAFSGSSAPSGQTTMLWYDTANNIMKLSHNGGSTWEGGLSLPLCLFSSVTSIDQVFNGFGYIGSTVFALPGVKGLIPNGRNEDGSLRNIEFTTHNVLTYTFAQNWSEKPVVFSISKEESEVRLRPSYYFFEQNTAPSTIPSSQWLNTESNLLYQTYSDTISWSNAFLRQAFICGSFFITSDAKVSNFNCNKPFHAVDRNDSSWVAQQAMPSSKYIDLTLGATDSTYTAPANGWILLGKTSTASGQFVSIRNNDTQFGANIFSTAFGQTLRVPVQCKKGDKILVGYSTAGTTAVFRFFYAEGEN